MARLESAKDRLIVALDVSTADEALRLAERLGDTVSFYKVGWQLFIAGEWRRVIGALGGKKFFVDLKLPADIDATITSVVRVAVDLGCVEFLTLSEHVRTPTVKAARAARGTLDRPKLLAVPLVSSLDAADLDARIAQAGQDLNGYILERSRTLLDAGCDGLIASGEQIGLIRRNYPDAIVVSPGIRPRGTTADDHKRLTTPAEAIRLGADYLVVGRPIRLDPDPRGAASRIIDEIDRALPTGSRSDSDLPVR